MIFMQSLRINHANKSFGINHAMGKLAINHLSYNSVTVYNKHSSFTRVHKLPVKQKITKCIPINITTCT